MKITALLLALGLSQAGTLSADQARAVGPGFTATAAATVPATAPAASIESIAPESWDQEDPADSIYRQARAAMNRAEHTRAADLFRRIWNQHPRSTYAPDAPYWEAFNRYRTGETRDLERALEVLDVQRERYERAQTRTDGDAAALATRIRGMLAQRGDEPSARAVVAAGRMAGATPSAEQAMAMAVQASAMGEQAAAMSEHAAVMAVSVGGGRSTRDVPEQCRDQVEMQLAALNALTQMNAERALPVLKQVMARRDECSPTLRRRAVFLIADKGGAETVDILLSAARTDPDVEVRRQAVFWLSEVDDDRAISALEEFVFQADDEKVQERAIFALSQHSDQRARQVLRRVVQSDDLSSRLRGRAVFWLGEKGRDEDVAFIRSLFDRTTNPELRESIIRAVALKRNPESARWLLGVAANGQVDEKLRSRAIFWSAEAGASTADLSSLYDRLDDRKLKERVLFALSETKAEGAIDKLIQIARTEEDIELRKKAIFWLSNSNDPRATEVLMEILTGGGGR